MQFRMLVRVEHLNHHGYLFGGYLLQWVDEFAYIAALEDYPNSSFVTRAMDRVSFEHSANVSDILTFDINRIHTGRSSVTYSVHVFTRRGNPLEEVDIFDTNVTMCCIDKNGKKAFLPGAPADERKLPKVAIIGISGYGKVHYENLMAHVRKGEIQLKAAVVINPDQVQNEMAELRQLGVDIFSDTASMYAKFGGELDLVCIPTGIAFHESMTIEALSHGAHVLVEKPLASSVQASENIIRAQKRYGRNVFVGFQHIHASEIKFIKHYLLSGRIGAVQRISVYALGPRDAAYYHRNNWAGMMTDKDGNSVFDSPASNAFAHYLNIALFFAGKRYFNNAHAVSVQGHLFRARPDITNFDTCAVKFETEEHIPVTVAFCHATDETVPPRITVQCEHGTVRWFQWDKWEIVNGEGRVIYSGATEDPTPDMFEDIVQFLYGERISRCRPEMAIEHVNCIRLMQSNLPVVPLKDCVECREADGQYVVSGVKRYFEKCVAEGNVPDPGWK